MGGQGLDWSCSGKEQMLGSCEHGNEQSGFIKFGLFPDYVTVNFSRRALLHWVS